MPWQHHTVIQREKDHGVISTLLTINTVLGLEIINLVAVDLSRVRGTWYEIH